MPVRRGRDSEGPFYQWGETGRRYRYTPGDEEGRRRAKRRAEAQGRAASARQHGTAHRDATAATIRRRKGGR